MYCCCFALKCSSYCSEEESIHFGHWLSLLGSQAVARSVLVAAAVHLTPVTLELGGKTPCLIYGGVNMETAARRLVWAKYFNSGQSCVAPDYVLCTPAVRDALLPKIHEILKEFYGADPQTSPDLSRIVSPRHWKHLMELLGRSKGKVVVGGEGNQEDRYIGRFRSRRRAMLCTIWA